MNYFNARSFQFILLFFLLSSTRGFCQYFNWATQIAGPGIEEVYKVATDPSGNVYTVGRFSGTVDFDPGAGTYTMTAVDTGGEPYILKQDASGNFIWAKQLAGSDSNYISRLVITPSKKLYLAGFFHGTVDFDPGTAQSFDASSHYNSYILELDTSGNFIAYRKLAAPYMYCMTTAMHVGDHDIWIAGSVIGTNLPVDFDFGPGTYTLAAAYQHEFVARYDLNFNVKWVKIFDHVKYGFLRCNNLVSDADKNIYHSGFFSDTVDLDPSANLKLHGSTALYSTGYISSLDSLGNFLWSGDIKSPHDNIVMGVLVDHQKNLYVSGHFDDYCDLDPGPGSQIVNSKGDDDVFLLKLNQAGQYQSSVFFGGSGEDRAFALKFSPDSNLVFAGSHFGADFDPGPQTFYIGAATVDGYVNVLDRSGAFVYALSFSTTTQGSSFNYCLDVYKDGSIYLGGAFNGTVDFNPGQNTYLQNHSQGQFDGCLVKLGDCNTLSGLTSRKICAGESTTLTITSAQTVTWSPGGYVGTNYAVVPLSNSTYIAVGTPTADCRSSLTFSVYVDPCAGINEFQSNQVTIYPNPNSGTFKIEGALAGKLILFSALGQMLGEVVVSPSGQAEISDLSEGIYFLVGDNWSKKVVVGK